MCISTTLMQQQTQDIPRPEIKSGIWRVSTTDRGGGSDFASLSFPVAKVHDVSIFHPRECNSADRTSRLTTMLKLMR